MQVTHEPRRTQVADGDDDAGTALEMTEGQVKPFAAFLQEHRNGLAHSEASDLLNELVQAVVETGKGGSLTMTIKVKPAGKGDHKTLFVSDDIRIKKPELERSETIFFVDDQHNLRRDDPRQPQLPLREVDRATGELREIGR
jgi:hypothetical protein